MDRLWAVCLAAVAAGGGLAAAQEPPRTPGKARLYVGVDPKATLSAAVAGKKLDPALALCVKTGGELAGRSNKGVIAIDVPEADKAEATKKVKESQLARNVADLRPATAGDIDPVSKLVIVPISGLVIVHDGRPPTADELKAAGLELVKENKDAKAVLVRPVAGQKVSAETIQKLAGIASVSEIRIERKLTFAPPERNAPVDAPPPAKKGGPLGPASAKSPGAITDPRFVSGELWGIKNAHVAELLAAGVRKSPVVVAVIDTGVQVDHEDLKANIWKNEKEIPGNGVDDDGNGVVDDVTGYDFLAMTGKMEDPVGHGTHCAGTIGAAANGIGVVGVCPEVKIMPLRFMSEDGGSNFDAALCIDYAVKNGAKVISASWGGYDTVPDQVLAGAVERARAKGVLFVAAAGNDGWDNEKSTRHWPSSLDKDNVIAVMAIGDGDTTDFGWWQSNYGKTTVHLAAPGHDIWSTVPKDKYAQYSGTSMATPHVAGAAALLYGRPQFKDADYAAVRKALLDNARQLDKLKDRCVKEATLDLAFLAAAPAPKK
ncbi:MAG: S8 family serine peptidase [Gemmataceae bacterium]|nr:S8 family serine peptidase [Gemmataceae bacterium]